VYLTVLVICDKNDLFDEYGSQSCNKPHRIIKAANSTAMLKIFRVSFFRRRLPGFSFALDKATSYSDVFNRLCTSTGVPEHCRGKGDA
jgi:hypothetical protein